MATPSFDFDLLEIPEPREAWTWDMVARAFTVRERGERTRFLRLRVRGEGGTLEDAGIIMHDIDGSSLYLFEAPSNPDDREPGRKVSLRIRGSIEATIGRYVDALQNGREGDG